MRLHQNNPFRNVCALALLSLSAMGERSQAAVMLAPGTTLPGEAYIALGQSISQGRNLWAQAQYASGGDPFYINAIRINERYALTINPNAHGTQGPFTFLNVGNGNNYFTDPGDVRSIVNVIPYPNASIDASIIEFGGAPLPGPDLTFADPPPFLTKVYMSAFGPFALRDGPFIPSDGNIRGWEMAMNASVHGGLNPNFYATAVVNDSVVSLGVTFELPGGANTYNSGGLAEDAEGNFIGLLKSGNPTTSFFQSTNFVKASPELRQFINTNAQVPEPTAALLLFSGAALCLRRRPPRPPERNA